MTIPVPVGKKNSHSGIFARNMTHKYNKPFFLYKGVQIKRFLFYYKSLITLKLIFYYQSRKQVNKLYIFKEEMYSCRNSFLRLLTT